MQIVADALKRIDRTQQIIGLSIVILIGIAGYVAYHHYMIKRERQAYARFTDSLEILLQGEAAKQNPEHKKYQQGLYEEAELAFQAGFDQHSDSNLAPYFRAMQASALVKQGKFDDAFHQLERAVDKIPTRSPLRALFTTQIALMKIDNTAMHEVGLQELRTLATDSSNHYQDLARYYLGQYYWSQGNLDEAKSEWLALIQEQKQYGDAASPWAQLAGTRISQIS
jgi:hypothetical protein